MEALTAGTAQKRRELLEFIDRALAPYPAVRAVVGIGSIAAGTARPDSDIDALVFFDPLDLYIVPAEFIWRPQDGTFHSIFSDVAGVELDLERLDMALLRDPQHPWEEGRLQELARGWLAFDRDGEAAQLIAARTAYPESLRVARLDEAITWLDQHLAAGVPEARWSNLGPLVAHDRLSAAYGYLVQALFGYNRGWRPWRNREMTHLLALPWLPERFAERVLAAQVAPEPGEEGYMARVAALRGLFDDLVTQVAAAGLYTDDVVGEAFVRSHQEPGRAWNMDAWNAEHRRRSSQEGSPGS
ncbi:MAG TPA: nucleotidyltransferase domain-containing protein [Roseiflexaceae bacterium]|nr:nucleotidyltransferase domain-containing protein [Roseiflexaceae bacterium]